jgi:CRP/FNR family transcriptional regulator, cyclic AMP receptor protein
MSDRTVVDFLSTVPLFQDWGEADLDALGRVLRRRTVRAGETLWRQGEQGREMAFVLDGALRASLAVPGDRGMDIADAGPGDMVGEIALLDGGPHTMNVGVAETATLLLLGRPDFAALLAPLAPAAFALRRRLARLLTDRHRVQLRHLAASLGSEATAGTERADARLEASGPPDSRYVRRLATFHEFDSLALWSFLTAGTYGGCPAGQPLVVECVPSAACYLTINGAVEKVLVRGDRRIRVGLAGPGAAFGYESLIDGGPSPITAITRERSLLLVIERHAFETLFHGEDARSRVFLDVILGDLVATLRETMRPQARLAASL